MQSQKSNFIKCVYGLFLLALIMPAFITAQTNLPGNILNQRVLGEHKILLIRVQYPGDEGAIVSDAAMQHVAAVVKESLEANSYGAVTITTDITPVLMMPQPESYYQFEAVRGPGLTLTRIRADAIALAERAGYPEANYDREVIYTKKLWHGLAIGLGTVNFRTSFVACGCDYLTVHEIGHSFDWAHANFWLVRQGSPISPDGKNINYGDAFDIMGDQIDGRPRAFHHFNPWYKSRVGWLPEANIMTVTQNGVYTVQAIENSLDRHTPVQRHSALRIKKDAATDYWVFYRAREEFANAGTMLTLGYRSNQKPTHLLDMTPGFRSDEWKDAALTLGHIFYDPDAGVEIKLLAQTAEALDLQVFVRPDTLGEAPVIGVLQPATGKTVSGAARYEVTAFDPDFQASNGAGIARVRLELENTLAEDSAQVVARADLFAPPYLLEVDTQTLEDNVYFLLVTAVSTDGDSVQIRFPHIIDNTGPSAPTSVVASDGKLPDDFSLDQNYPNPFSQRSRRAGNPATRIRYSVARVQFVSLKIYDVMGREVATLVNREIPAGSYEARWDGRDALGQRVTSGVYVYRLQAGGLVQTRKMLLLE